MAITRNFNGASIRKPGAYSRTETILSGGFPLAPTGVVGIVGEAAGGEPGSTAGVRTYTSEDIGALIAEYKSGPIVDAARLLTAPARDARVPNGASQIRVYKTNGSTRATLALENAVPATLFNVSSANFGDDENLVSVTVEAGVVDTDARIVKVAKGDITETLSENQNADWMDIQYTGAEATATITIQGGTLAVDTGGTDDISITLADKSLQQVVDLIDANPVYSASTTLSVPAARNAEDLDPISTATDVKTAAVTLKAQQKELLDIINGESSLITVARVANVEGTIAVSAKQFLTGGTRGASSNTDFQNAFDALLAERCNTVVPLISRDAADLITDAKTDPASAFTLDSVNLAALTHCITASNTKNRSERNCYVSHKGTFAEAQEKARNLNSERASMAFQDVQIRNSAGNLVFEEPWALACILAGVQSGTAPGTPTTFKFVNINGFTHDDYNAQTQVDLAIDAGLTPLERPASGGFRIVVGNTTYSRDADFVNNRVSVLEAADTVSFNLRQQLEAIFVGNKIRTGTAESIRNTVISIMNTFLQDELIVGDDTNDGRGFKDLTVTVSGNTANVDITITPVQGIDFVLATIRLDNIQQSA